MVQTDTLEGIVDDRLRYHYDFFTDVLYLRLISDMQTLSIGEQTDDGDIELHEEETGRLIGITIINWWKRYGYGSAPDSLKELGAKIEPWASKVL
jgi:uncharacterized protein YuzE